MFDFSQFLSWAFTGTNGYLLAASSSAFIFIVMLGVVLFKAIWKIDLTRMFYEAGHHEVSHTKFWNIIACFCATVAFLFVNFTAPGAAGMEFIWLTYLGVIAGSASVSKLIGKKYSTDVAIAEVVTDGQSSK